jgi:dCTP deaminase
MTNESAISHRYIPMFEGRSSIGRLGINTHITAGFGDVGWGFEKVKTMKSSAITPLGL